MIENYFVNFMAVRNIYMKLLFVTLTYIILSISESAAVEIYNCNVQERDEYAFCGYGGTSCGSITPNTFPKPPLKNTRNYTDDDFDYTIIWETNRIIVKRKHDGYEREFERANTIDFSNFGKDRFFARKRGGDYISFEQKKFFLSLIPRGALIVEHGICN